ncbi:MAG: hypothetical protein ACM3QZ_08990 [Solirubrobacterales bacterium]
MNKGDLLTVYMNGKAMTICVVGSYKEDYSGEEMVVLALINPDSMVHVPISDLDIFFPARNRFH